MLLEKIEETIKKFEMLKKDDRVIIAISGGPDSTALAYLFNKLKKDWNLTLHLAHLNHMLRGKDASRDSAFVQDLAKKFNLPFSCERVDVKAFAAKARVSLEDAARRVRYEFFLKVAEENLASKIALGHNRDDQVETVLMRFLRGSGISGLRGMPPTRRLKTCLIIRPLIEISRKQILDFLSAKDITFCTDSSNLENFYFRNRIRNELLPSLEKDFNPNLRQVLINFAENISEDFDFLEQTAEAKFKTVCARSSEREISYSLKRFFTLHKALQKLTARSAIKKLKGNVQAIDYRHWKELEDLIINRPKNSIVDLPGGVSATKNGTDLVFYKRDL